jgi:flavin reductase (DIM6/NTAB) family NADH-FMN oxidoreductase RutF
MPVSKDDFKAVMGSFASGVTVVTTVDADGGKWGITVSAFSSLSMDPPLCLVCIDKRAGSLGALTRARRFAVNVLSDAQDAVSNRFASRSDDKFAGMEHEPGPATGCPVFPGALAWMECEVADILPGGDHEIFVGTLVNARVDANARPLVYWRGAYGDIASRPKSW